MCRIKYSAMKKYSLLCLGLLSSIGMQLFAEIPAGYYYRADGKNRAELKTALYEITRRAVTLSYGSGEGATWEGFYHTDRNPDDNSVIDRYSGTKRYFDPAAPYTAVDGLHIEHALPKSWWGAFQNNAYRDLHHLYPADGQANMSKNNLPLGEVASPTFDNGMTKTGLNTFGTSYADRSFEPADRYKGDFARSYFYVVTAYQDLAYYWDSPMMNNETYPVWKPWAIDLLLKWHREDPVSDEERLRSETVYDIQGNRNPFVDYPDLVEYIWGKDTLHIYTFPAETSPFLATPVSGETLDLGVAIVGDRSEYRLDLRGANLKSPLQLSWKHGGAGMQLSETTVTARQANEGVTIRLGNNAASPGEHVDTLLIAGNDLTEPCSVPVRSVTVPTLTMLTPSDLRATQATLHWTSHPQATGYRLDLYQGDLQTGDLFISAYIEGSGWNKAIELYNGTGAAIDLSAYSLRKQSNGVGEFKDDTPLSGVLAAGDSYLIVSSQAGAELKALANRQLSGENSVVAFNGNDAVALYRNGVRIDVVGIVDGQGMWGENCTLYRVADVSHPTVDFDLTEWQREATDHWAQVGRHLFQPATVVVPVETNLDLGASTVYRLSGLRPQSRYTCRLKAVTPQGDVAAAYTVQLKTADPEVPELFGATHVAGSALTLLWDEIFGADAYQVQLFTLSGQSEPYYFDFAEVGSNGTPLPEGWSGTASGNYTTAASSGEAAPSVALKNAGEWIQTSEYHASVTEFRFMYRFPSAATGSSLLLEAQANGVWSEVATIAYENTKKQNVSYTFEKSQAVSALKITYRKERGNLAIDDVYITCAADTTIYFDEQVAASSYRATKLHPATTYSYRVRSVYGDIVSPWSEAMEVSTASSDTGVEGPEQSDIKVAARDGGFLLLGLSGMERISVYDLSGRLLTVKKSEAPDLFIPLDKSGIYLLRIESAGSVRTIRLRR